MSKLTPPFLLLLLVPILSSLPFQGNSQAINGGASRERSVLLDIKRHFSDPSSLSHWTAQSGDHCTWPEITCSGGSVTGLRLVYLLLNQTIPPSLCDLGSLTALDLNHNLIPGDFPAAPLSKCSNLEFLDLSFNAFNGSISGDLGRLSSRLRALNLSANYFTGGVPPAIGALRELRELHLAMSFNSGSLPPEIGELLNLEVLDLNDNPFSPQEIPPGITNLNALRMLWLRNSNLVGEIPEKIGNMTALESLDLSGNSLTGEIPGDMFLLKNLTNVYLSTNRLRGPIPASIDALNLNAIDLSNNSLTGRIPEGFGKLAKLEALALFQNQLSGEVPGSIGMLPGLRDVRIFSNNLSGRIPGGFGQFSKLQTFDVSTNNLVGSLPEGLCDHKVLSSLIAFGNNLTGEIPKSLGDCDSLSVLRVERNRLSGRLPNGLWTSRNLSKLFLNGNLFTGELPQKAGPSISQVEISENRFSGEIPAGVSSWANLVNFKAGNNLLTGEIPQELTVLPLLSVLWLDGNQLSGTLPQEIVSWKSLTSLKCSKNQLSGEIPSALGLLLNLNELDLSGNQFSGGIPPEIGQLRLTSLNVSSNLLSGRIPDVLENAAFDKSFLNNTHLCSTQPSFGLRVCKPKTRKTDAESIRVMAILGSIAAALLLAATLSILLVLRKNKKRKEAIVAPNWKLTPFHKLSFDESNILSNLTESNAIGSGASGEVYLVDLHGTGEKVAVKRIWNAQKTMDLKLEKEFEAEVEILGTIRHYNIVKLLCGISSEESKLLVYEYMENRSLDLWLHPKRRRSPGLPHHRVLQWPTRLRIAIGAAQGLCYLHHNCSPPILHRDVKTSNVLLDSEFNAKIADFGLARTMIVQGEPNVVSSVVGSYGYIAPEYAQRSKVNEKIDVYSFGVILLELVTGREPNDGSEELCLADWAWQHVQGGEPIADAVDASVKKKPQYLKEMEDVFKLGVFCTATSPSARPTMKEVLQILLRTRQVAGGGKTNGSERDASPLLRHSRTEEDDDEFVSIV